MVAWYDCSHFHFLWATRFITHTSLNWSDYLPETADTRSSYPSCHISVHQQHTHTHRYQSKMLSLILSDTAICVRWSAASWLPIPTQRLELNNPTATGAQCSQQPCSQGASDNRQHDGGAASMCQNDAGTSQEGNQTENKWASPKGTVFFTMKQSFPHTGCKNKVGFVILWRGWMHQFFDKLENVFAPALAQSG